MEVLARINRAFSNVARGISLTPCFPRTAVRYLLMACLMFAALLPQVMRSQTLRENQLKAAFILNFARFTEWPADAFAATNSPLIVGVLGTDSFTPILAETVHNESVQGHPLKVEHYRTLAELKACHILFISVTESARLTQVLNAVKDRPVLTVSEIEDSAYRGVIIRMYNQNNRIQLRINLPAAKEARLSLSSKLIRVAAEVIPLDPLPK
jgi:hypothetical protein